VQNSQIADLASQQAAGQEKVEALDSQVADLNVQLRSATDELSRVQNTTVERVNSANARVVEMARKLAAAERRRDEEWRAHSHMRGELQEQIENLTRSLAALSEMVPEIEKMKQQGDENATAASDALQQADVDKTKKYVDAFRRGEIPSASGRDAWFLELFYASVSDHGPYSEHAEPAHGGGIGITYPITGIHVESGSLLIVTGFDSVLSNTYLNDTHTVLMYICPKFGLRLRVNSGDGAVVLDGGYQAPAIVGRRGGPFWFPLVGFRGGLGYMVDPNFGIGLVYQYYAMSVRYPEQHNLHNILFNISVAFDTPSKPDLAGAVRTINRPLF